MKEVKNAVAYIRVSTQMQVDGFSLDGQLGEIKEYCKRNRIKLLRYYEDAGKSGTSIKDRVAFNEMIEDIKNGGDINTVIVWKLSRLSRSVNDLSNTIEIFEKHGVRLMCTNQNVDTYDKMGKAFAYMSGIFAEMERDNIVESAKMGMRQRAIAGKWNGGKVFGYRSVEDSDNGLMIMDEEAEIIREIFELFTNQSYGYKKIAVTLNNRGKKTLKGTDWSINSIKQIIDNPLYAGYIRWGKYVDWSEKRRKGKQEEYIVTKGIHSPIITEDTWEEVKKIREIRGKTSERVYEGNFILTGLIKCPVCNATMISHRKKKRNSINEYYRYYQCSNFFNKGKSVCSSNLLNADLVEKQVIDKLNEIVNNKEVICAIVNESKRRASIDKQPLEKELKSLESELNKIDKKKREQVQLEYEDKIDINTLNIRILSLMEKENDVNSKIDYISREIKILENSISIDHQLITQLLQNFTSIFEAVDFEKKKKLLKSIIEKITIADGNSSRDRKIDKIKLYFEPEEIQVIHSKQMCASEVDTGSRIISDGCF